jgi:hypothetical protein
VRYFFTILLLLIIGAACKPKRPQRNFLKSKLIETMSIYLHKTLQPGVNFTIQDVMYVPEKAQKLFVCQFNVNIHYQGRDTLGTMQATISYDFDKVTRTK